MRLGADPIIDLAFKRHADELRASWQARLLMKALKVEAGIARPQNAFGACVLSVMSHNFDDAMPVLLRIAFPEFQAIGTPFLSSAARIAKTGHIMADFVSKTGQHLKNQAFFKNSRAMERAFRKLADEASLDDADRNDLFNSVKRWVVADYRLDPTMSPADPDAKRLAVH